ncbi:hypothetical protein PC128_g6922 [Phytophthora cactorum]|nr:hypothetical protein PC128_g6922 [Phytophthora cactorum]
MYFIEQASSALKAHDTVVNTFEIKLPAVNRQLTIEEWSALERAQSGYDDGVVSDMFEFGAIKRGFTALFKSGSCCSS